MKSVAGDVLPPPELHTQRLIVRIADPSLAPAMAQYYARNRAHHEATSPLRAVAVYTEEHWRDALPRFIERWEHGTRADFVLLPKDDPARVVGDVMLDGFVYGVFQACYMGYKLDESYVGKGYMHEALRAVLHYAFDEIKLHRVMANYMPGNQRSANVLKRLGFRIEGRAPNYLFINGKWEDHVLSALHADEFVDSLASIG